MPPHRSEGQDDSHWTMAVTTDELDDEVKQTRRRATERLEELTQRAEELLRYTKETHIQLQQDLDLLQKAIDRFKPRARPRAPLGDAPPAAVGPPTGPPTRPAEASTRSVADSLSKKPRPHSLSAFASTDPYLVRNIDYWGDEDWRGLESVRLDAWRPVRLSRQNRKLLSVLAEDTNDGHYVEVDIVPYKTQAQVLARMRTQGYRDLNAKALITAVSRLREKLDKAKTHGRRFVQSGPYGYRLRVLRPTARVR